VGLDTIGLCPLRTTHVLWHECQPRVLVVMSYSNGVQLQLVHGICRLTVVNKKTSSGFSAQQLPDDERSWNQGIVSGSVVLAQWVYRLPVNVSQTALRSCPINCV
jgi:hypothetical protein